MSEPGQIVASRYRLDERLGRGAQGETWVAHDTHEDAQVALKIFRLSDHTEWKPFDLFERECRVLRSLEHPSIPRYFDHGGDEDQGLYYLAMQRVHGETLADRLAAGHRYDDAGLQRLLDQLLAVLEYLHSLRPPVIHRDLNPNNVVIDAESRAWLVDFGGVREAFQNDSASTIIGTHGYMAPEQLHGEARPASDLYSLGATITAMAAGTDASDLPRDGLAIDMDQVLPSGRLRDVLAWMLQPDPRRRPSTASEVGRSLFRPSTAASTHPGSPQPTPIVPAPRAIRPTMARGGPARIVAHHPHGATPPARPETAMNVPGPAAIARQQSSTRNSKIFSLCFVGVGLWLVYPGFPIVLLPLIGGLLFFQSMLVWSLLTRISTKKPEHRW